MKTNIEFEKRAVAFVDVLGFKNIVNEAPNKPDKLHKLIDLYELLNNSVPEFNKKLCLNENLIPKYICISDSIILSAPLQDDKKPRYSGLALVIMRCIQLTHHFLNSGFLIRGGIEVGDVWHTDSNIIGPAYQQAYLLETCAKNPQISIGKDAQALCEKDPYLSEMFEYRCDQAIVNSMCDLYIPDSKANGAIEETYRRYFKTIDNMLNDDLELSVELKWQWFKNFLIDKTKDYAI